MTSAASFNNSGRYSSTDIKGLAGGTTSVIFDGEFESTNILKLFSFRQYHCSNVTKYLINKLWRYCAIEKNKKIGRYTMVHIPGTCKIPQVPKKKLSKIALNKRGGVCRRQRNAAPGIAEEPAMGWCPAPEFGNWQVPDLYTVLCGVDPLRT